MPGATLPPDQARTLDLAVQRLERLERATVMPGFDAMQSGASALTRIHAYSNGTASSFLGGSGTNLVLDQLDSSWSSAGVDLSLVGSPTFSVVVHTDGIYAVTAVFQVTSNDLSTTYTDAAGGLSILGPQPTVATFTTFEPAVGPTGYQYGEFTVDWTGYLKATTIVYIGGDLRDNNNANLPSWDYAYGDLYVQRLA